jgi:hypothetical protein
MIDLMLDYSRCEIYEFHAIDYPFRIEELHLHPAPPLDFTTFSWHREASFFISTFISRVFYDLRIYHSDRAIALIFIVAHERDDDDTFTHSYLWCCESDSAIFWIFDMLEHALDEITIAREFSLSYRRTDCA